MMLVQIPAGPAVAELHDRTVDEVAVRCEWTGAAPSAPAPELVCRIARLERDHLGRSGPCRERPARAESAVVFNACPERVAGIGDTLPGLAQHAALQRRRKDERERHVVERARRMEALADPDLPLAVRQRLPCRGIIHRAGRVGGVGVEGAFHVGGDRRNAAEVLDREVRWLDADTERLLDERDQPQDARWSPAPRPTAGCYRGQRRPPGPTTRRAGTPTPAARSLRRPAPTAHRWSSCPTRVGALASSARPSTLPVGVRGSASTNVRCAGIALWRKDPAQLGEDLPLRRRVGPARPPRPRAALSCLRCPAR